MHVLWLLESVCMVEGIVLYSLVSSLIMVIEKLRRKGLSCTHDKVKKEDIFLIQNIQDDNKEGLLYRPR